MEACLARGDGATAISSDVIRVLSVLCAPDDDNNDRWGLRSKSSSLCGIIVDREGIG